MKAEMYNVRGEKKSDIELPESFSGKIREDIASKAYESDKYANIQPYSSYKEAGKRHSASGTIAHRRHEWKGQYGRGISRVPRKAMWRRGTQFNWVGAEVSNTRGGRRAHPPRGVNTPRKMNKKEMQIAMRSALASSMSAEMIKRRYSSLSNISRVSVVMEEMPKKTKDMKEILLNIFKEMSQIVLKEYDVRAGKGKSRGRKYKSNSGVLLVVSDSEKVSYNNVEVRKAKELKIADLFPLGRIAVFSKKSLEELKNVA